MKNLSKVFYVSLSLCVLFAFTACKKDGLTNTKWELTHSATVESDDGTSYEHSVTTQFEFCKKGVAFLTVIMENNNPQAADLNGTQVDRAVWKLDDDILSITLENGAVLTYKAEIAKDTLTLTGVPTGMQTEDEVMSQMIMKRVK